MVGIVYSYVTKARTWALLYSVTQEGRKQRWDFRNVWTPYMCYMIKEAPYKFVANKFKMPGRLQF